MGDVGGLKMTVLAAAEDINDMMAQLTQITEQLEGAATAGLGIFDGTRHADIIGSFSSMLSMAAKIQEDVIGPLNGQREALLGYSEKL